jgi:hypothetical protein
MPFTPNSMLQPNLEAQISLKNQDVNPESPFQRDLDDKVKNGEIVEGKWDDQSNLLFIVFIDFHSKIFSSKEKRK